MTTAHVAAAVPVMLDLRAHRKVPGSPDGYVELWERLEPVLVTVDPRSGPRVRLDFGEEERSGSGSSARPRRPCPSARRPPSPYVEFWSRRGSGTPATRAGPPG